MEVQWAEDWKLEESLERRRMEGSSLQAEVMQKVPELVVHEPMSQGEEVRGTKKKKVKEWSTEEMKDKANSFWRKTQKNEEMENQEEMDHCWKELAERMEEEVLVLAIRWNGGLFADTRNTE